MTVVTTVTMIAVYWLIRLIWIVALVTAGVLIALAFVLFVIDMFPSLLPSLHGWLVHP